MLLILVLCMQESRHVNKLASNEDLCLITRSKLPSKLPQTVIIEILLHR